MRKLQPAHGGADSGASYQGRKEKDDNLRLALAVGELLSQNGVNVEYTRTDDLYQTPFEKAQIANTSGADFFISFHRNSSPFPNQYSGVEVLVYNKSGLKLDMAENINGALGELGFREIGVQARPGLVVLRRTKMPALLIETGFLNTDADNETFDRDFHEIAQAIASAILGTLDEETFENESEIPAIYYRVQTGSFRERSNADSMLYGLLDKGYPAFLLHEDGLYKVQVGAFRVLENAVKMEQRLRRAGYSTFLDAAPYTH